MKNKILLVTLAISLAATACANNGGQTGISKQNAGMALGAIGGGIAGNAIGKGSGRTVATIGGAVLGGMAGNSIGTSLDNADRQAANAPYQNPNNMYTTSPVQNALENARTNERYSFTNPDGSVTYVTPTRTYTRNGYSCRDYVQGNSYGGQNYGSACRQPNGTWM